MNEKIQILIEAILSKTSEKELEKQLKQIEKKVKPIELDIKTNAESQIKLYNSLQKIYKEEERQRINQEKASDKEIANREKILQYEQKVRKAIEDGNKKEQERTRELQQQIVLFQKRMSLESNKITGKYGTLVDSSSLKDLTSSISNLSVDTPNLTNKMKSMALGMKQIEVNAKNSGKAIRESSQDAVSFGDSIKNALFKFSQWYILGNLVTNAFQALKQGVSYILGLDNSLNEIRIVTGKTNDEVQKLADTYNRLAKQMNVTTKEISSEAANLFRQGLDEAQVEERMKAIIKYAKISGLSLAESDKIITATANSTGESVNKIIDIFSLLGDTTSSGAEEIGQALQKVSASAENSSVSIEKASSWISTISSKTRESSSVIGNSLKSLMARYEQIKSTGFNSEDSTRLNDVVKSLADVGIKATDAKGQLIPFDEMLDTVGKRYSTMTKNEQAYVTTALGGSFQRNRLVTLLNNYDDSLKNYEVALNSAGTAEQKFLIYQDSASSKIDRFKASLEGFADSAINSSFIKGTIDLGTKLVDTLGNIPTVITTIVTAISLWKGTQLTKWFNDNKIATEGWRVALIKNRGAVIGMTEAEIAAKTATTGWALSWNALKVAFMSNPIGAIATAILTAVTAMDIWNQKQEEARQEAEEYSQKLKDELSSLNDLKTKYAQIISSGDLTKESKERLKAIQEQLIKTYGLEKAEIDKLNGSYKEQLSVLDELQIKKLKEVNSNLKSKVDVYGEEKYSKNKLVTSGGLGGWNTFGIGTSDYKVNKDTSIASLTDDLIPVEQYYKHLQQLKDKIIKKDKTAFQFDSDVPKTAKEWDNALTAINDELDNIKPKIQNINDYAKNQIVIDFYDKYEDKIKEVYGLQDKLANETDISKKTNLEKQINDIKNSIVTSEGYISTYNDSINVLFNNVSDSSDGASDSIDNQETSLEKLNGELDTASQKVNNYESELANLNQTLNNVHKGEKLNNEQINDLLKKYPELSKYVVQIGDSYQIEAQGLEILKQVKTDELNTALDAEVQKTKEVMLQSGNRLTAYQNEIESIKDLQSAQAAVSGLSLSYENLSYDQYSQVRKASGLNNPYTNEQDYLDAQEAAKAFMKLGNYYDSIEKRKKLLNSSNYGVSGSGSKKGSSNDPYMEAFENELKDLQYLRDKDKISEAQYYNSLESLNKKYFLNKKKYLDDYRQYEVEIYNGRLKLAEDSFNKTLSNQEVKLSNIKTTDYDGQINMYKQMQDTVHKEADRYRSLGYKDTDAEIVELGKKWKSYQDAINNIKVDRLDSALNQFKSKIDDSNNSIAELQHNLNMLGEGDFAQKELLTNQILKEKQKQLELICDQIVQYTKDMKAAKTEAEKNKIKDDIDYLQSLVNPLEESIYSDVSNLRIEAINLLKDAEQERHEQNLKNLDDELSKYQDFISEKKKALDDLFQKEDYERDIAQQNQDILAKQNEINALGNDNSADGLAKKAQLEQELNDLKTKKEDTQRDYTRKSEKDMYDDLLDIKERSIKQQQDLENENYNKLSSNLDNLLTDTKNFHADELSVTKYSIDEIIKYYENLNTSVGGVYDNLLSKLREIKDAGLSNPISTDTSSYEQAATNDNKIVQMASYLMSQGHSVEWKNKKVYIDDKAIDMVGSGIEIGNDNHYYGSIEDIKKLLRKNGIVFDSGGLAYGKGFMFKDTVRPEEVLSPENTVIFRNLVAQLPELKEMIKKIDIINPALASIKPISLSSLSTQQAPVNIEKIETHVYAAQGMDENKLANLVQKKTFEALNNKLNIKGI